ncbi:hypothetical protein [Cysteiniphilum sp. 6C5]|uniref:hypothetical protein n=1 Tax=unclassified Cysteiniphilum TaxID=2610889 RepID=UPI003F869008
MANETINKQRIEHKGFLARRISYEEEGSSNPFRAIYLRRDINQIRNEFKPLVDRFLMDCEEMGVCLMTYNKVG